MARLQRGRSRRPAPDEEPPLADLLGILRPPAWTAQALCGQADPDAWFPERDDPTATARAITARRICRRCPVRVECLQLALHNDERHGIWGGTSPNQRKIYRHATNPTAENSAA